MVASENEKLKREVYTKSKLLEAQEISNNKYVAELLAERDALEANYLG